VLVVVLSCVGHGSLLAATFTPTTFSDLAISSLGVVNASGQITNQGNAITLRSAVIAADAGAGADTVQLLAGTYVLSLAGDVADRTTFPGNPLIGSLDANATGLTIQGNGPGSTIISQTTTADRILTANGSSLTGFAITFTGITFQGGVDASVGLGLGGGALFTGSNSGTTTVTNCRFLNNKVTGTGSLGGGAILHTGGNLTVGSTTFGGTNPTDPNSATAVSGGAISYDPCDFVNSCNLLAGTLSIQGSTFINNSVATGSGGGGAVVVSSSNGSLATANIDSSTFTGNKNTTGDAGAIMLASGTLNLTKSTFDSNQAQDAGRGGVLRSTGTSATVQYCRFVNNSAATATNGNILDSGAGTFSATDNWWASNTGAKVNDIATGSLSITSAPYLRLVTTASPSTIVNPPPLNTSTLTADFTVNSASTTVNAANLVALIGPTVTWAPGTSGNISGAQTTIQASGKATATFTPTIGSTTTTATATMDAVSAGVLITVGAGAPVELQSFTVD
jgi:hypothetical protein